MDSRNPGDHHRHTHAPDVVLKNIDDFCASRGIGANMEEAFIAYIRSDYARKYETRKDGDTTKLVVSKMNEEELKRAWGEFVKEVKKYLPME